MAAPVEAIADEIAAAYASRTPIAAFTAREGGLDLPTAYAVEAAADRPPWSPPVTAWSA